MCQGSKFLIKMINLKSLAGDYPSEMKKLITLTRVTFTPTVLDFFLGVLTNILKKMGVFEADAKRRLRPAPTAAAGGWLLCGRR